MKATRGISGDNARAIAASVERAVLASTLRNGELLPTIRELAASLHVSPVTVAAAYRLLQSRGLVAGNGRRGTRVRPRAAPPAPAIGARAAEASPGVVDLSSGNPDLDLLPPLGPALRAIDADPHHYGDAPQLKALMTFAAGELAADGIRAGAITVTGGALDAIERVLREHLRPGDRVAVEDPTLPALLDQLAAAGYVAEPCAIDADGPQPEALERALRRDVRAVIVTPRAQNPTGAALTPARARDLARLFRRRRDVLVIENDPAGPVSGAPALTLTDAAHARWAVIRSTSKFLGPDLRLAIVAGDELTVARVQLRQALGTRWVSHLLQRLALALWSDPASGRRLARASEVYAQRRDALTRALAAHGMAVTARSGLNVWIAVREETATVQALADRGWAVAAGERFRLKAAPAVRVTTSVLAAAEAERFAADLASASRVSPRASA